MLFSLVKRIGICFIYIYCGKLYNKQVRLQQVCCREQTQGPFHLIFKMMFVSETKLILLITGKTVCDFFPEFKINYY